MANTVLLITCPSCLTEHTCFQPRIAESSVRVEPLDQTDEVGQALVKWSERCRVRAEELAPVWACLERGERALELGEYVFDRVWLGLPGEVYADGVFTVVHAHPQPIRGHRANLGHLQDRPDLVCEGAHGLYGLHGVPTREQIL